jgi:type II secretory pathway component PulF
MTKSLARITLNGSEKISLITNLSTMLSAGIPIIEAVNSMLEDTKGGQKIILETLHTDLMQGNRIYSSLGKFPGTFDAVTINLIRASEEAGTLETTLEDLRSHIQKEMEFVDRIRASLIYPIVIIVVFVIMLTVILIFVVPKLASVFKQLKIPLPLPTRIMIYISDIITQHTIPMVVGLVSFLGLAYYIVKRHRAALVRILTNLPLVSNLTKDIDLTRFCRNLYLLLSAGLPITTALELSQNVVIRAKTAELIKTSREMVISGKQLSEGLKTAKGYLPSIMIKLVEAGEKSGSLDKTLQEISEFLDYQVSSSLKNLTALMEPIMLVLVGLSVGGMMMAIIAPIYGLVGQIGGTG